MKINVTETVKQACGLRTISQYANQVAFERLFLCLEFGPRKTSALFLVNLIQSASTYGLSTNVGHLLCYRIDWTKKLNDFIANQCPKTLVE